MEHQWQQHPYTTGLGLDSVLETANISGGHSRRNPLATQSPHFQQPLSPNTGGPSPFSSPRGRDDSGDIVMQDTHDVRTGANYPSRPNRQPQPPPPLQQQQHYHHQHQQQQSYPPSGRIPTLQSQESSSAATRYSPLGALSPTSSYAAKPIVHPSPGSVSYRPDPGLQQQPQSPRQGDYAPQSPYFQQQASQLPHVAPYSPNHDSYSPGQAEPSYAGSRPSARVVPQPVLHVTIPKGPVPEFKKVRGQADLRPKVNGQPAFRRANPEGGFISVCLSLYGGVVTIAPIAAPLTCNACSPYKPSQFICPPHIELATQTSNTSPHEIHVVFSPSLAKV